MKLFRSSTSSSFSRFVFHSQETKNSSFETSNDLLVPYANELQHLKFDTEIKSSESGNALLVETQQEDMSQQELFLAFHRLSAEHQALVLQNLSQQIDFNEIPLTSEQEARLMQLETYEYIAKSQHTFLQNKSGDSGLSWIYYHWADLFDQMAMEPEEAMPLLNRFLNDIENIKIYIMSHPDNTLVDYAQKHHPELAKVIDLKDLNTQDAAMAYVYRTIEYLRSGRASGGHYDLARDLAGKALSQEFEFLYAEHPEVIDNNDLKNQAQKEVNKRFTDAQKGRFYESCREQGLSGQEAGLLLEDTIKAMEDEVFVRLRNESLGEYIYKNNLSQNWPTIKKDIFNSYASSIGAGYLWSDETWDTIVSEVAINAPLIVVSGGVANMAVKGVSLGARAVLTRVPLLMRLSRAAARFPKLASLSRAGVKVGSLTLEAAFFNATHDFIRHQEWFMDRPSWGSNLFWTAVTLGTFKGAARVSGKLSNATLNKTSHVLKDTRIVSMIGSLEKAGVSRKFLEGGFHTAMALGVETAALFLIGAAQYSFTSDGTFWENFSDYFGEDVMDHLFHSFVAAGSLKMAHGVVSQFARGKGVELSQKERQRIEDRIKEIDRSLESGNFIKDRNRLRRQKEYLENSLQKDTAIKKEKRRIREEGIEKSNNELISSLSSRERELFGITEKMSHKQAIQTIQQKLYEQKLLTKEGNVTIDGLWDGAVGINTRNAVRQWRTQDVLKRTTEIGEKSVHKRSSKEIENIFREADAIGSSREFKALQKEVKTERKRLEKQRDNAKTEQERLLYEQQLLALNLGEARLKIAYKNGKLSHEARMEKASEYIGRELSKGEMEAIRDAHLALGRIGDLTLPQLAQKVGLLRSAGLSSAEIRILVEKGIVGETSLNTKGLFSSIFGTLKTQLNPGPTFKKAFYDNYWRGIRARKKSNTSENAKGPFDPHKVYEQGKERVRAKAEAAKNIHERVTSLTINSAVALTRTRSIEQSLNGKEIAYDKRLKLESKFESAEKNTITKASLTKLQEQLGTKRAWELVKDLDIDSNLKALIQRKYESDKKAFEKAFQEMQLMIKETESLNKDRASMLSGEKLSYSDAYYHAKEKYNLAKSEFEAKNDVWQKTQKDTDFQAREIAFDKKQQAYESFLKEQHWYDQRDQQLSRGVDGIKLPQALYERMNKTLDQLAKTSRKDLADVHKEYQSYFGGKMQGINDFFRDVPKLRGLLQTGVYYPVTVGLVLTVLDWEDWFVDKPIPGLNWPISYIDWMALQDLPDDYNYLNPDGSRINEEDLNWWQREVSYPWSARRGGIDVEEVQYNISAQEKAQQDIPKIPQNDYDTFRLECNQWVVPKLSIDELQKRLVKDNAGEMAMTPKLIEYVNGYQISKLDSVSLSNVIPHLKAGQVRSITYDQFSAFSSDDIKALGDNISNLDDVVLKQVSFDDVKFITEDQLNSLVNYGRLFLINSSVLRDLRSHYEISNQSKKLDILQGAREKTQEQVAYEKKIVALQNVSDKGKDNARKAINSDSLNEREKGKGFIDFFTDGYDDVINFFRNIGISVELLFSGDETIIKNLKEMEAEIEKDGKYTVKEVEMHLKYLKALDNPLIWMEVGNVSESYIPDWLSEPDSSQLYNTIRDNKVKIFTRFDENGKPVFESLDEQGRLKVETDDGFWNKLYKGAINRGKDLKDAVEGMANGWLTLKSHEQLVELEELVLETMKETEEKQEEEKEPELTPEQKAQLKTEAIKKINDIDTKKINKSPTAEKYRAALKELQEAGGEFDDLPYALLWGNNKKRFYLRQKGSENFNTLKKNFNKSEKPLLKYNDYLEERIALLKKEESN